MSILVYLIPIALLLGLMWLAAFIWSIKAGQYSDLDGAAHRILIDEDEIDAGGSTVDKKE